MKKYNGKNFCTTKELAVILHVAPRTVRNWITSGHIGYAQVGRRYLVPESEVTKMLQIKTNKIETNQ